MTQVTSAQIKSESTTLIANAGVGQITPAVLDGIIQNIADSFASPLDGISNPAITDATEAPYAIAAWGDSLTTARWGVGFCNQLAALLGRPVLNMGIGGQTAGQISARHASASRYWPCTTIIEAGTNDIGRAFAIVGITQASPGVVTTSLPHGLATGQSILIDGIVGPSQLNLVPLTVTVLSPTTFSIGIDTTHYAAWTSGGIGAPAGGVVATIAQMVARLGHSRYLVLSLFNAENPLFYKGQPLYNIIQFINNQLATTYGVRYFDAREYLVQNYNPSLPQDVTDFANDVVPTSLRHDSAHPNTAGYTLLATKIAAILPGVENAAAVATAGSQVYSVSMLADLNFIVDRADPTTISLGDNAFPSSAMGNNQSVFIGQHCGATAGGSGQQNTVIGYLAINNGQIGSNNTILGAVAGSVLNGLGVAGNTILGANACPTLTQPVNCTIIGANVGAAFSPTLTGAIAIGTGDGVTHADFNISIAGAWNFSAPLGVNGLQVIGPRDTGWAPMTGAPDKATALDTSTVTLAQLAARVAQLQAALTAHGLIGA